MSPRTVDRKVGIYCIENTINKKKYIGQGIDTYERFAWHKSQLKNRKHFNSFLLNSWNKYGEESFIFYVVEECKKDQLNEREIFFIDFYKTRNPKFGYNLSDGGGGRSGYVTSDETKRKIGLSNLGKKRTEEQRKNISDSLIGKPSKNLGRKMSDETKRKNSESHPEGPNGFKDENSTSKYIGVWWDKSRRRWCACCNYGRGKRISLGRFKLEIDAAKAYDKKCYELYGDKAKLNFPEDYNL